MSNSHAFSFQKWDEVISGLAAEPLLILTSGPEGQLWAGSNFNDSGRETVGWARGVRKARPRELADGSDMRYEAQRIREP